METSFLDKQLNLKIEDFQYVNEGADKVVVSYQGSDSKLQGMVVMFRKRKPPMKKLAQNEGDQADIIQVF